MFNNIPISKLITTGILKNMYITTDITKRKAKQIGIFLKVRCFFWQLQGFVIQQTIQNYFTTSLQNLETENLKDRKLKDIAQSSAQVHGSMLQPEKRLLAASGHGQGHGHWRRQKSPPARSNTSLAFLSFYYSHKQTIPLCLSLRDSNDSEFIE